MNQNHAVDGRGPVERLQAMADAPTDRAEFERWLTQDDSFAFLKQNAEDEEVVIYAGLDFCFLHAVSVPVASVSPTDVEDLLAWNCNASSGWGISHDLLSSDSVVLEAPLHHSGSSTIDAGQQLVFARSFEGRIGHQSYFEILQPLTQALGLHYLSERDAYCRIDAFGDVVDVIRVVVAKKTDGSYRGTIITVQRNVLEEWMHVTRSVIARMFDFTRFRVQDFSGWTDRAPSVGTRGEIYFRSVLEPGRASYVRGCQLIRPASTRDAWFKGCLQREPNDRAYESCVVHDWKNRRICEVSTTPDATANYFTASELPFETSPAFFRPDVLAKYKADPDKYRVEDRSISCRGAWHLQTYDVNEAGQVHTYIVYLRQLPFHEQQHWKAYNEPPKAPISKRALTTDFKGEWDVDYNPLNSIKALLEELHQARVPWWTLRSRDLVQRSNYPVSTSVEEWANELMNLDQLVVEGFEERWLRQCAKRQNLKAESGEKSLALLERCLTLEDADARDRVAPLRELHDLRTKLKGHARGEDAIMYQKRAIKEHGSFGKHFRSLAQRCDEALRAITAIMEKVTARS